MEKKGTKIGKWVVIIIVIAAILSRCELSDGKIKIPFGADDRIGSNYSETITELEEAGFTNIEKKTVATTLEERDDGISGITVDGEDDFSKNRSYEADVPIVIEYYEFQKQEEEPAAEQEEEEKTEAQDTAQQETEAEEMENEVTTQTKKKKETKDTVDEDSLEKLAKSLFGFEYEELSVSYDDFDEAYVVKYRPVNVQSVTTFIYQNINRYIHFCQTAYELEGLERVRFDVQLLGQDQYGEDYEIEGLSEIMTKEYFEKFNWENLEYLNIYDAFVDNCYYFGIAPEIVGDVDKTMIFYDPFTRDGKIE